jgi:alcohol dehydrogenase class IV
VNTHTFRSVTYPLRLYSGVDALNALPDEVKRAGARRVVVICGHSVATKTDLLDRIAQLLGKSYIGAYSQMSKDSSWPAVRDAHAYAQEQQADLLIALGGGSVIVATRVVAILLGETGDPFDLMTQYPPGKPAFSPRLNAPKPPIINVVTTPTSAMCRAGSGLKNDDLDHRMEFYDPKTRPCALFWDSRALQSAPVELIRSTATTTFCGALRALAADLNPLVQGSRRQAFHLVQRALPRILTEPDNAELRLDLCAAAFLENRAADDDQGRRRQRDSVSAHSYALATALHIRYEHVWQGESTTSVMPTVTRLTPPDSLEQARTIATALGIEAEHLNAQSAADASAEKLTEIFSGLGMPVRLRELQIPQGDLPLLATDTLKNFNANPGGRTEDYVASMQTLLAAAW